MLKIQETKNFFKDDKLTDKSASFTKLLPLISAKFPNSLRKAPNQ